MQVNIERVKRKTIQLDGPTYPEGDDLKLQSILLTFIDMPGANPGHVVFARKLVDLLRHTYLDSTDDEAEV